MSKSKAKRIAVAIFTIILVALIIWTVWGNKAIETNTIIIESDKIAQSFDSYRIVQVSDLHNDKIGRDNEKLIDAITKAEPDIIVITGDLIDSRKTDVKTAVEFAKEAVKIAPIYYISGNHEVRIPTEYETLKAELTATGVFVLENETTELLIGDDSINLTGINDPDFYPQDSAEITDKNIKELKTDNSYTILLSHRPELFDVYVKNNIDLVFTGHAHGGQFRLPFVGGLFAPHQGAFPKYDSGLYSKSDTDMIVSRGIGNSIFPFRFNNRPEIIVAQLKAR